MLVAVYFTAKQGSRAGSRTLSLAISIDPAHYPVSFALYL